MANRPTFLLRPGPCPNCPSPYVNVKHILVDCPLAVDYWPRVSDVMASILTHPIPPPTKWWEVIMGSTELGPDPGTWMPVWLAIHGAALNGLYALATQFRHQDTPVTKAAVWSSFRNRLAITVASAYKADTSPQKEAFWSSWGQSNILASPTHPRQLQLTDITLLAGVVTEWPT